MTAPGESSAEFLLAWPGMKRVPSPQIELFHLRDFVPAGLRAELVDLIDAGRRPSTIADDNGDRYFRTSETCDLDPGEPAVQRLEAMLEQLNGIAPAHGEPMQGQRYAPGQEFKPHTDCFTPEGVDYRTYCAATGQRTWTFMIYLNDVAAGGATRFRQISKTFQPEAGKLLCWNNRRVDGSVNPYTLHQGMKVRKGTKYIITKWYREKEWQWE